MLTISTNVAEVQRELQALARTRFPGAIKGVVNALAKEIWAHERQQMPTVFDRPTPFVLNSVRVLNWATTAKPYAEIGVETRVGRRDKAAEHALEPHIPGYSNVRAEKQSEFWLKRNGFMRPGEFLVPSRTMPRDRYGNVRGSTMQKMLADVGAFRTAQGFDATTGDKKARYVFGTVNGRKGKVRGIWQVQGGRKNMAAGRWKLMMLVVKQAPLYRKRFDFHGIGQRYATANLARLSREYVARALQR